MIDFPNYLLLLSSLLRNCLFSPLHLQTEREDLLVMFFTLSWMLIGSPCICLTMLAVLAGFSSWMLWILLTQMGW